MGKFSDYLDDIKNQTDGLRTIVSDKSGVDCANLSIEGVAEVVKNISFDKEPVLQEKFVDPDVVTKIVEADAGYDGLSKVHFTAVTSAIDSNILADNIKKDVTILGVTGTLEQGGAEDLTAELTAQDTALTSLESAVDKLPEPKADRLQWKCDNVKSLKYEFDSYAGRSLDEIFSGLDTSQVINTSYTFYNCSKISVFPPINTSKVENMNYMYSGCGKAVTLPMIDMISATSATSMMNGCINLENVTLRNIKIAIDIGASSGTFWGTKLTDESIINTAQELWDNTDNALGSARYLRLSNPSKERVDAIYVKLLDVTEDMIANDEYITNKKPCVVCESTDEGAMTLREYILSKNWTIA